MISLKELKYVDTFEQKAPYPGDKYAKETLELMIKMYEKFKKNYKDKRFSIIFSDAIESEFEIFEFNLCHMLGVNHSNLINGTFDNFLKEVLNLDRTAERITSYQLLTKMLENYEEVVKYDASERLRTLNYYKSRIKCAIFEKISEFESFNFGKIETNDSSTLLYTPSNEAVCPYFFFRIDKGDNVDSNVVTSLLAPEKDEVCSFFDNKATAIPTQMIIDDNQNFKKMEATAEEKINMLNMYKLIITEYGLDNKIDISGDYLSTLAELSGYQKRR